MYPQEKSPLDFSKLKKGPSRNIGFELLDFLKVTKIANFLLKSSLVNFDTFKSTSHYGQGHSALLNKAPNTFWPFSH